ncbi:MAG: 50S ribosomal protein L29 [Planctomycetota bacterium]
MRLDEIRGKDDADLEVILENTRRSIFDHRFKSATGDIENPNAFREMKKTVARIKTVLVERTQGIRGATPHKDD